MKGESLAKKTQEKVHSGSSKAHTLEYKFIFHIFEGK